MLSSEMVVVHEALRPCVHEVVRFSVHDVARSHTGTSLTSYHSADGQDS